jgi:hypothetical protein
MSCGYRLVNAIGMAPHLTVLWFMWLRLLGRPSGLKRSPTLTMLAERKQASTSFCEQKEAKKL